MGLFDKLKKKKEQREKAGIKVSVSKDNYTPGKTTTKKTESKSKSSSSSKKSDTKIKSKSTELKSPKRTLAYTNNPTLSNKPTKNTKKGIPDKTKLKVAGAKPEQNGHKKGDTISTSLKVDRVNKLKKKSETASAEQKKRIESKIDKAESKIEKNRADQKQLNKNKNKGYKAMSMNETLVYQTMTRANPNVNLETATEGFKNKDKKFKDKKSEYADLGKNIASGVRYSESSNPFGMGVLESVNLVPVHELVEKQSGISIDNTAKNSSAYKAGEMVGLIGTGFGIGGVESGARILGQGVKAGVKNFAKNAGKATVIEAPLNASITARDTMREVENSKFGSDYGDGIKENKDSTWTENSKRDNALSYTGKQNWNNDILERVKKLEKEGREVFSGIDKNGFAHFATSKKELADILGYYNNAENPEYTMNGKTYTETATAAGKAALNAGLTAIGGGLLGGAGTAKAVKNADNVNANVDNINANVNTEVKDAVKKSAVELPSTKKTAVKGKTLKQKAAAGPGTSLRESKLKEVETMSDGRVALGDTYGTVIEKRNGKYYVENEESSLDEARKYINDIFDEEEGVSKASTLKTSSKKQYKSSTKMTATTMTKVDAKTYETIARSEAKRIAKNNRLAKEDVDILESEINRLAETIKKGDYKGFNVSGDTKDYIRKRLDGIKVRQPADDRLKEVQSEIGDRGLSLSKMDKSSIADFTAWKRNNAKNVKVREDGRPVDTVYTGLSRKYPDLFPEEITNPADQLVRISDTIASMKQKNVPLSKIEDTDGMAENIFDSLIYTSVKKNDTRRGMATRRFYTGAGSKKTYSGNAKLNAESPSKKPKADASSEPKSALKKESSPKPKKLESKAKAKEEKMPFEVTSSKDKTPAVKTEKSKESLGIISDDMMSAIKTTRGVKGAFKKFYNGVVSGTSGIEDMERLAKKSVKAEAKDIKKAGASKKDVDEFVKTAGADKLSGDLSSIRSSHEQWQYVMDRGIVSNDGKVLQDRGLRDVILGSTERTKSGKLKRRKMSESEYEEHSRRLNEYALARHGIKRVEQGKPVFSLETTRRKANAIRKKMGMSDSEINARYPYYAKDQTTIKDLTPDQIKSIKEDNELICKYYEKKYPETVKIANDIDKWWNDFMQTYAVDTGVLSKEQWKELRDKYPHYVPTYRQDKGMPTAVTNGNRADTSKTLKTAKGGDSMVLPIEDQFLSETSRIISAGRKNKLYSDMFDMFEANPKMFETYGATLGHKEAMDTTGNDLSSIFLDSMESAGLQEVKKGLYVMKSIKNGEVRTATISKEVYDGFRLLDDPFMGEKVAKAINKTGATMSNFMKMWITGLNPVFTLANIARDVPTMLIQSDFGMGQSAKNLTKAGILMLGRLVGKEFKFAKVGDIDIFELYKAMGGKASGYYHQGKGFKDSLEGNKNPFANVTKVLSGFSEAGESIPRLAEFWSTIEKYGTDEAALKKALANSATVTVDFSRTAAVTKALDGWVLYLNAAVQGLDKFAKTVKEHPGRTAGRAGTMMLAPALTLAFVNADNPHYMDLSERTRQNYFCIPNISGEKDSDGNCKTFIKIPYSREYGTLLGGTLDMALMYAKQGTEGLKQGKGELWSTFKTNFAPPSLFTDNLASPLLINLYMNKDFAGRTIVSEAIKNDTNPLEEYDATTSGAAKAIAGYADAVLPEGVGGVLKYFKSPKKVDYMIDSYTGYLGTVLQASTSGTDKNVKDFLVDTIMRETAADPFIQKFTADPRYSSQPVTDFYKEMTKAEDLKGEEGTESYARYKAYNSIKSQMTESYKAEKEILADEVMSDEKKTKEILKLREARNKLAKSAKEKAEKWVKNPEFYSLDSDEQKKYDKKSGLTKKEYAEAKQTIEGNDGYYDAAVKLYKAGYTLEEAQGVYKSITDTSYAKAKIMAENNISAKKLETAKSKADVDGNGSLKKSEVINYIEAHCKTQEEKKAMYSVMANSNWKSPY